MGNEERWLDQDELDMVMLPSPESRRFYEEERWTAEISKALRRARKEATMTDKELALNAGVKLKKLVAAFAGLDMRSMPLLTLARIARAMNRQMTISITKVLCPQVNPDEKGDAT